MSETTEEQREPTDRREQFMARFIDPLIEARAGTRLDPRIPWVLLGLGMLVSLVYCLWVTRGTSFSGDEMTWLSISPGMDLEGALTPHSGHLVLIPHAIYKFVFETIGTDYLTFRLLTLGSVYLAVGLFFVYARKRVGGYLALAPCLVLLFFGSDTGHILQGNGFTIMFSIACGMGALVALDRETRGGDIVASLALVLGLLTYTNALPFLAGAVVLVLLGDNRWRRLWVVAIPIGVYLAWRVWLVTGDIDTTRGGLDVENIVLLPSWIFQSLSGILSSLTGLNYNFHSNGWLPPGEMAGPPLALIFVVAIAWRLRSGMMSRWLVVAFVIALALFTSQVLTYIPAIREPGTSRYLYPGAFVVLLVLIESFRTLPVTRTVFISVWLIALAGFATNAAFIKSSGNALQDRASIVRGEVTATTLVASAQPYYPGASARPIQELLSEPAVSTVAAAEEKYGGVGFTETEILGLAAPVQTSIDTITGGVYGIGLTPADFSEGGSLDCRPVDANPESPDFVATDVPASGLIISSNTTANVKVKRFGPDYSVTVGTLMPDQPALLTIPPDNASTPWQVAVQGPPVSICDPT